MRILRLPFVLAVILTDAANANAETAADDVTGASKIGRSVNEHMIALQFPCFRVLTVIFKTGEQF